MVSGGGLKHSFKDGQARIDGFLEDYAWLFRASGSPQSTLDSVWLTRAIDLTGQMLELFYDGKTGLLYDTRAGTTDLILRPAMITTGLCRQLSQ